MLTSDRPQAAAFHAMTVFATEMRALGWPSLPGLLGSMHLMGGRPSDPGIEDDWNSVVSQLDESVEVVTGAPLAFRSGFDATFHFLALQFKRRGLESLDDVVSRLQGDGEPHHEDEVAEDWDEAIREGFGE